MENYHVSILVPEENARMAYSELTGMEHFQDVHYSCPPQEEHHGWDVTPTEITAILMATAAILHELRRMTTPEIVIKDDTKEIVIKGPWRAVKTILDQLRALPAREGEPGPED